MTREGYALPKTYLTNNDKLRQAQLASRIRKRMRLNKCFGEPAGNTVYVRGHLSVLQINREGYALPKTYLTLNNSL